MTHRVVRIAFFVVLTASAIFGGVAASLAADPGASSGATPAVDDLLNAALAAAAQRDWPTAKAKLAAARGVGNLTETDTFRIGFTEGLIAINTGNRSGAFVAYKQTVASPLFQSTLSPQEQRDTLKFAMILANETRDFAGAIAYGEKLSVLGTVDEAAAVELATAYLANKDYAKAASLAQKAMDAARAENRTPDAILADIANEARGKLPHGAAASLSSIVVASAPAASGTDALGMRIDVNELSGLWLGTWIRRPGTNIFDATWHSSQYPDAHDVVRIESINGKQVTLTRDAYPGGHYTATLSADGRRIVDGTATWYKPGAGWTWTADISETASSPAAPASNASALRLNVNEVNGAWLGVWTRRPGTNIFDAVWHSATNPTAYDTVRLQSIVGDQVTLTRDAYPGEHYTGTLSADGRKIVTGTATWYQRGAGWTWSANISGTLALVPGAPTSATPPDLDTAILGAKITVNELNGLWRGVWTRRPGTNVFDAVWHSTQYPTARDVVRVASIKGNKVELTRDAYPGQHYELTLSDDGSWLRGTATWYARGWTFEGRIEK